MAEPRDPIYTPLLERLKREASPGQSPPPPSPPAARPAASRPQGSPPGLPPSLPADFGQDLLGDRNATARELRALAPERPREATPDAWFLSNESVEFLPLEPTSLEQAQLREGDVTPLVLKSLLARGVAQGREIAQQIRVPYRIVQATLKDLRQDQWVIYKASAQVDDFVFELTPEGREHARRLYEQCSFCGSAPVSLEHYTEAIRRQSLIRHRPGMVDLQRAFADLLLSRSVIEQMAQAVHAGQGLFVYGAPGNGKSSIATRISRSMNSPLWIPRTVGVEGEIIRLFDPCVHEETPLEEDDPLLQQFRLDPRWVRIKRPTIIVGGELTMDRLEVTLNKANGTCEASLQLKSNGGTLLIDDFGRQRVSVRDLLNRWIVPLERRIDYLTLKSGRAIEVPFDQLIVFSTNLEPHDLVDEAFLRRIPYKVEVCDPTEVEFRELFRREAANLGVMYSERTVDYLIERHYRSGNRPFRCCHPRDLVLQASHYCAVRRLPPTLSIEAMDAAVKNYFSVTDRDLNQRMKAEAARALAPVQPGSLPTARPLA